MFDAEEQVGGQSVGSDELLPGLQHAICSMTPSAKLLIGLTPSMNIRGKMYFAEHRHVLRQCTRVEQSQQQDCEIHLISIQCHDSSVVLVLASVLCT